MTEREEQILRERLMPQPVKAVFKDGADYRLTPGCAVKLNLPAKIAKEGVALAKSICINQWKITPEITVGTCRKKIHPEGCEISIRTKDLTISASTPDGLRNALKTLRQLAEPERGVEHFEHYILPRCEIADEPAFSFRGIHICWFPETPLWEIEKQIRLAAYFKYNYVVLEPWGIFPYKCHPEFYFSSMKIKRKDVRRLVALGRELGVTLIPQINIFGHASWARSGSGKHATLGSHFELASLFEPDGWSWCLSNPHTRQYIEDLITEIMEVFGNPPYFHAGCDEADNMLSCSLCRKAEPRKLVRDHLLHFYGFLRERGAKMLMWHDMLLNREDERWKGYIVCGSKENGISDLYKDLPDDILICDWQYGQPKEGADPEWPTSIFFKEAGFNVLVCPWYDRIGAEKIIRFAAQNKLGGVLQTTWHRNRGFQMPYAFIVSACCAWNPGQPVSNSGVSCRESTFNGYLRQVDQDMNIAGDYKKSGRSIWQIVPESYPD